VSVSSHLVLEGILPSTESTSRDWVSRSDFRYRSLAGNGDFLSGCGKWMVKGCLEDHSRFSLTEGQLDLSGGVATDFDVVEAFKASCGRLACPVCYEKACAKEAIRIEHRTAQFCLKGRNLKPIHVVVSPSEADLSVLLYPALRAKAYAMALKCGMIGGSMIVHPFRLYNEDDKLEDLKDGFSHMSAPAAWYLSPHFHIIGYGWIHGTAENYAQSGWIVKNVGIRESVRATAMYQLSHCGVSENFHSVTWFGALSYNKLKVKPVPEKDDSCPVCASLGRESVFKPVSVVALNNDGFSAILESTFEEEGIYYVDKGLFEYTPSKRYGRGDGG
jgi:hypothetical protein